MKILIDIPDKDIPKEQDILNVNLSFIDGQVGQCNYPFDVLKPCDDCISRQAVLSMQYRIDDSTTLSTRDVVNVDDIEDLPSVTPVEKVGHWIDDNGGHGTSCSECDKWYPHSYLTKREIIYCCRCGVKMEVEE